MREDADARRVGLPMGQELLHMKERILGYDVREMWCPVQKPSWLPIPLCFNKVMTIDSAVWGSIFNDGNYPNLQGEDREKVGLGTVELPPLAVTGLSHPLWDKLADMEDYLCNQGLHSGRKYWIVAFTLCQDDPEQELRERTERMEWPYCSEPVPDRIQLGWNLAGYDVTSRYAEGMITSHVLDVERQTPGLQVDLNPYMLFSDLRTADRYRAIWDEEDTSLSPHLVFGIWRIRESQY